MKSGVDVGVEWIKYTRDEGVTELVRSLVCFKLILGEPSVVMCRAQCQAVSG